jgi:hypothetical protein
MNPLRRFSTLFARPRPATRRRRPPTIRLGVESLDERIVLSSSSTGVHAVIDSTGGSVAYFRDKASNRLLEKTDINLTQALAPTGAVTTFSAGLDRFGRAQVFAMYNGRLEFRTDSGGTWQDTLAPRSFRDFAAVKGGRLYAVGTDDSLWKYESAYSYRVTIGGPFGSHQIIVKVPGKWSELLGPNSMNDLDAVTEANGIDVVFGRDAHFTLSEFIPGTTSHLLPIANFSVNAYSAGLDTNGYADVFAVAQTGDDSAELRVWHPNSWTTIAGVGQFTQVTATGNGQAFFADSDYGSGGIGYLFQYDPSRGVIPLASAPINAPAGQIAAAGPDDLFEVGTDGGVAEYAPHRPGGDAYGWRSF